MSSLPSKKVNDSAEKTKSFFNNYYEEPLTFPSNQVDAVIGFFEKRGFQKEASISVAGVLLKQAKLDDVNVFKLIDTLKGLDKVALSAIVTEILNFNRPATSMLGYKSTTRGQSLEIRNIVEGYPKPTTIKSVLG